MKKNNNQLLGKEAMKGRENNNQLLGKEAMKRKHLGEATRKKKEKTFGKESTRRKKRHK